ncbi:hypothetical protein GCM10009557_73470 [Virgisporangium ochraceum]|uniref:DUF1877 domain-containing protein n=2 Tax=Virgisporangium ochraceum TaxID=65505 RepID=A0A8J4A251_9ACTN|nr:hypothetical protein Voc01_087030 [Virgisporangium ochraceum]
MGMVMSFHRVTPDELARVVEDPGCVDDILEAAGERAQADGSPDGDLDKSWAGLDFLLAAADVPVDIEDGVMDYLDDDGTVSVWDATKVAEAARVLRSTPFGELARHHDPARMTELDIYPGIIWVRDGDEALDWLRECYEALVAFLDDAASRGCAVVKTFG